MKITTVIAECNPLHNGHAYLFAQAREKTDADYLVVLLSGDFVQRGEPALLDKHRRARAALCAGADLVLSLPVIYTLAPAELYARGAVLTLEKTGIVSDLVFGSEIGELQPLSDLADLIDGNTASGQSGAPLYSDALQEALRSGMNYPRAVAEALRITCPEKAALTSLLDHAPNNVLGMEYLRSLKHFHSAIRPHTILRLPASTAVTGASVLRGMIAENRPAEELAPYLPDASLEEIRQVLSSESEHPMFSDAFSGMLQYALVHTSPEMLSAVGDIGNDLADRIYSRRLSCESFDTFAEQCLTRSFTLSRIRRSLMQLLLGLKNAERAAMLEQQVTLLRVLGFRKSARNLLSEMGTQADGILIIKGADFNRTDPPLTARMTELERLAGAMYAQAAFSGTGRLDEASKPPVVLA